ncbi:MAG: SDR family oxidoreductase [Lentisphaeria bacterium]|nr:SDR family oxidoreductase [Lentisphaeria bacterium]
MKVLDSFSLTGKTALITGGAGLFGRQIVESLAEAGAETFMASRNLAELEKVAGEFRDRGLRVTALELDLGNEKSIEKTIAEIVNRSGRLDILINNAVTRSACAKWSLSMDDFDRSLRVNASGLFCITRLAAEEMKKRQSGSIVNVGSYMGLLGPNPVNYEGTDMFSRDASPIYFYEKGGMVNFTRFAASVLGIHGIRVNCINPGGFLHHQPEAFIRQYSANTMLGRLANDTDLKGVIVFLASDASLYLTGCNIPVDGGYTAK